ncbi:MAG: BolA family transcriptional regulator [Gammaproteobacteria bacterium]|nr:BolA family transcriptional regulator [Gammaproteobacteria bacterium]
MADRIAVIKERLQAHLSPLELEIEDQSALHSGHAGARDGGGHFAIRIISDQFTGKSLVERHRMVYRALADAMQTDIHALSIKSLTPEEM